METEKFNEIIQNGKNMEISNQGFIKNGWKLLKKINYNNNYYALVECTNCGKQQLINFYTFTSEKHQVRACKQCKWESWGKSMIGKIINVFKIIDIDKITYSKNDTARVYFKVECTKCGHVHTKLFNESNWKKSEGCDYCRRMFEDPFIASIHKGYTDGAKQRNLKWEIPNDLFIKLINSDCAYCGTSPQYRERKVFGTTRSGYSNGIDRIDSSIDYIPSNVVSCCSLCNIMKNNLSKSDFLNHIQKINNFIKQGSTTISEESTLK